MLTYKTMPANQNKSNITLTIVFGVCGLGLYLSTVFIKNMPLPWLAQLISVIMFAGCLYCLTWMIKGRYMYVIEDSGITSPDGIMKKDLVVVRISGKNREVLCRIGVDEMEEIDRIIRVLPKGQQSTGKKGGQTVRYTSDEKIQHINDLGRVRKPFRYQVDLITRNETVIITEDLLIRLTYDKGLEDTLKALKKSNE